VKATRPAVTGNSTSIGTYLTVESYLIRSTRQRVESLGFGQSIDKFGADASQVSSKSFGFSCVDHSDAAQMWWWRRMNNFFTDEAVRMNHVASRPPQPCLAFQVSTVQNAALLARPVLRCRWGPSIGFIRPRVHRIPFRLWLALGRLHTTRPPGHQTTIRIPPYTVHSTYLGTYPT